MKKINRKVGILILILVCFIVGGTLSFESMARFTKKFDGGNQSISVGAFNVEANGVGQNTDIIKPGDTIGEDTITLTNDNDYPVEFTIKLKTKEDNEVKNSDKTNALLDCLKLTINDKEVKADGSKYIIVLNGKSGDVATTKELKTKVEWPLDSREGLLEDDELDYTLVENATVSYDYDIKAKQLTNDELKYYNDFTDEGNNIATE